MRNPTILLVDRAYQPLGLITWQDCYKKIAINKARFLVEPDIVQLIHRVVTFNFKVSYSKKNIILRDKQICQYCGKVCEKSESTVDHILPDSRGGKTSFLNCVLACKKCNSKKEDKTPQEANMKLLRIPVEPSFVSLLLARVSSKILEKFYAHINNACKT